MSEQHGGLVLSRKVGESVEIFIGNGITVTVVEIRGSKHVRLRFSSDRSIAIHRSEVAKRIKESHS